MGTVGHRSTARGSWVAPPRRDGSQSAGESAQLVPRPESPAPDLAEERLRSLIRTVEAEIIPRLLLAHCDTPSLPGTEDAGRFQQVEGRNAVTAFAKLVVEPDADAPYAFVDSLRAGGASIESLYLGLFAPTARHLGELWEQDLCDFTEVMLGLSRLQHFVRELGPEFRNAISLKGPNAGMVGRALLVPPPGEPHTLGIGIVADFFARAGWDVWGDPPGALPELVDLVRGEWFDLAGFTVAIDAQLDLVTQCVEAVRKASVNKEIFVMVGGAAFLKHPERARLVGADAYAPDARSACEIAAGICSKRPARS